MTKYDQILKECHKRNVSFSSALSEIEARCWNRREGYRRDLRVALKKLHEEYEEFREDVLAEVLEDLKRGNLDN